VAESSGLVFSPAEAGEEVWAAYTKVRTQYRAGGMSIQLFMLHVVHSADALMGWGCIDTALRLLSDVGAPILRRELPELVLESRDIAAVVLGLAYKLRDSGYEDSIELTVTTAPGGRLS
jgi:hypothetical protein